MTIISINRDHKVSQGKELFKQYLRKVGSGEKTSCSLSREEAANALRLILEAKATPAQIGAFMIAHRIKRPEPQELAGMLDTYLSLGPKIKSNKKNHLPLAFGMPFDGRKRTAPIFPLTTLVLLSANQPILLVGGKRMPIKFGVTTEELFNELGLKLKGLSIKEVQTGFEKNNFAFIYQPEHFPLGDTLINYRDEIGKRPPLASMELLWSPLKGDHILISGFVHPPTEERAKNTIKFFKNIKLISVKGLEGSIDLPTSRPCITGNMSNEKSSRLILYPRKYQLNGKDIEFGNLNEWRKNAFDALNNKGPFLQPLIWNAGVYLWFSKNAISLQEGLDKAKIYIREGLAKKKLEELISWRCQYNS